jgi:predicted nucleic acid binding AN1-type Zn finger protein
MACLVWRGQNGSRSDLPETFEEYCKMNCMENELKFYRDICTFTTTRFSTKPEMNQAALRIFGLYISNDAEYQVGIPVCM